MTEEELARVEAFLGAPTVLEVSPAADASLWSLLASRGHRVLGTEALRRRTKMKGVDFTASRSASESAPARGAEGNAAGLHEGDTVSGIGHFRADRQVVEQSVIEVHYLRRWKEGLGVLGLLGWIVSLPFLFRWRGGRLWERGDG